MFAVGWQEDFGVAVSEFSGSAQFWGKSRDRRVLIQQCHVVAVVLGGSGTPRNARGTDLIGWEKNNDYYAPQ